MGLYYRLCIGLSDIGTLFPIETSPYDIAKDLEQEIFKSVYLYNQAQYEESNKMVEVVNKRTGETYSRKRGVGILTLADGTNLSTMLGITNQLIFDFDCKDNLEKAKADTIEIIDRLKKRGIPENTIDVFFSGMKGFAIKVYLNQFLTSVELHSICTTLIDGLETADTVVYNDARIVRLPYSKHGKSGLYCTPITIDELVNLKIEDIRAIASVKYSYEENITRIDIPEELLKLKDLKVSEKKKIETRIVGASFEDMKDKISKLDFTKKTPFIPASKWVLQQGFIPAGHGQEARMILASTYKAMGMDKDEAYYQLKSTSTKRKRLLGKQYEFDKNELWDNVLGTVYSDAWQGGTYSFDHPLLATIEQYIPSFLRAPKDKTSNITTKDEAFAEFVDYSKEIDQNTIRFGIPSLDRKLRVMTKNVYALLASPGAGKTSWLLQVLENTSNDNIKSIYFSFDMANSDSIAKILMRHTNTEDEVIMEHIKSNNQVKIKEYKEILDTKYKNTEFVFKPGMSIEDMENTIRQSDRDSGNPTKLIAIDYLSLIKSTQSDSNMKTIECIQGLRYLSHTLNVAVIVLVQPNKANATVDEPITSYSAIKGSSEISEVVTAVLTMYREGYDARTFENDIYTSILCVKNRKGALFSLDFGWHGMRGHIHELSDQERSNLKEFRKLKEMRKAEEKANKGNGW